MRWWSAAPVRIRLTAWYAAVLAVMLVLYASATYWAVRHEFVEEFDDQLHEDLERSEALLTAAPDGRVALSATSTHDDYDREETTRVEVWSVNGELMSAIGPTVALPPAVATSAANRYSYETVEANDQHWRTLTGTAMVGGRGVILRVARSEERLRGQVREVLGVLVIGLPLVVGLAGIGGYILARRALAPIDHIAADAQRITAERLHERLSVPNKHDEIGRLAAVINDAFARLELSFDRLRRFTADASHELRTPLAVVRGIGEAGLAAPRSPDEYRDAIGSMLEEIDRMTGLVDTLLRLSHADAGSVRVAQKPYDLNELASEVVASLSILGEERNQRLLFRAADPVVVSVDPLILREAVTNIVDNAIKYSPRGTSIDIAVQINADAAVLIVADRGPGIAAEHRERIFDRFFRVDEARSREQGGAGLGLSIAKWAIEINGGSITVDERSGGGAIFRITLPLSPATAEQHAAARERVSG